MPATTVVRVGQVWVDSRFDLALVFATEGGYASVRFVAGSRVGEVEHHFPEDLRGGWKGWRLHHELPRLRCTSHDTALEAARFLTGKGLTDVLVDGDVVTAPLTVTSVMQFADDVLEHGWAHDDDCARMIGELG